MSPCPQEPSHVHGDSDTEPAGVVTLSPCPQGPSHVHGDSDTEPAGVVTLSPCPQEPSHVHGDSDTEPAGVVTLSPCPQEPSHVRGGGDTEPAGVVTLSPCPQEPSHVHGDSDTEPAGVVTLSPCPRVPRGRPMYAVAVALCRAVAWGYFASVRLEVLALTRHREDWSLRARWRLTGLPLHLCLLRFYRRDKGQLLRSYDAFSTFFLNSQGLIRCHRVDKVSGGGDTVTPVTPGRGRARGHRTSCIEGCP
nr:uncharacterized protein C6orf136 homolog [Columba livia]